MSIISRGKRDDTDIKTILIMVADSIAITLLNNIPARNNTRTVSRSNPNLNAITA